MNIQVRSYTPKDYDSTVSLYRQSNLYGGQFDENRDSFDRLKKKIEADPDAILLAEQDGKIFGTISLIEDGRVAWLFRFAVAETEHQTAVATALHKKAVQILKDSGHTQVLVYSPIGNNTLDKRYEDLDFNRGEDYTCFWQDI